MKKLIFCILTLSNLLFACKQADKPATNTTTGLSAYLTDTTTGVKTGGIQMVQISTPKGKFNVWTKKIGNNPKMKLLLLNGGPGATHEYFECMESFLPKEGIEIIYYDQLGCGNSDNPKDTSMWSLPRYVEEVEQVRQALKLDKDNFYLLGHSWGGILAAEYAFKYQDHLKGLIISNMMMSCPAYGKYAVEVLARQFDPKVLARIRAIEAKGDFANPEYMGLLMPNFYVKHICRIPLDQWPEPLNRSFGKMNQSLYVTMQGPSEFGIAGKLLKWDRTQDLPKLSVPVLSIGGEYDTMDPKHMQWIATRVQNGTSLYCPKGSHMSMYDDQEVYMAGLTKFIKGVDAGNKKVKL
ncbi:proline iminopeptidase-family hydrolase [Mucilaginibacter phyllosphaerae]|uniref:Alpha/beta fold hydrolase n=1 Tax=Mucilaginibacter phyllosphaerae TaxID=1812349 RepID=A0A4Y8AJ16_9SPHI|nr:proline iminopeptidase-family hydrolase [Mucilaginibacter phyllosphaerae]MBB3968359.1 proline iminopeptidase [Mucilaginibacter phyllosphaerae]TEW68642.1 alpha/beta fold hydrolase [Mucilaginibacter phyllosphaerae]GGG99491.1 proline iminopeptidase [Mucilaginibacter phyllosphaerae]